MMMAAARRATAGGANCTRRVATAVCENGMVDFYRRYYWSPMSPVPRLLASLVEAMGIDNEIHRNRADVLSRRVARLPT